jgi:hypothetical protein
LLDGHFAAREMFIPHTVPRMCNALPIIIILMLRIVSQPELSSPLSMSRKYSMFFGFGSVFLLTTNEGKALDCPL